MLDIPTDHGDLLRQAMAYAFNPAIDAELADRLQAQQGSAADRLFGCLEVLYAFRDRLGDEGLELLGRLAGYVSGHGWVAPGEPRRFALIHLGVLRDLGDAGSDAEDPAPRVEHREDRADWRGERGHG